MPRSFRSYATIMFAGCVLAGMGCGGAAEDSLPDAAPLTCFAGDPTQPAAISPVYRALDGSVQPIDESSQVPLILPPQGGKVLLIGVRGHNLDGCPVTIRTALIDPATGSVISLEQRPVLLQDDGALGLEPRTGGALSSYSNLPGCPLAGSKRPINGEPYLLSVSVDDKLGRHAEAQRMIVPVCGEPEHEVQCRCECAVDYKLGDPCT